MSRFSFFFRLMRIYFSLLLHLSFYKRDNYKLVTMGFKAMLLMRYNSQLKSLTPNYSSFPCANRRHFSTNSLKSSGHSESK